MAKQSYAEFLGTFFLVFFICGAIGVNALYSHALGHVGISLVCGLTVTLIILAIGHISGAHINPAVTIALALIKKISWPHAVAYIVAQVLGGIVGYFLLQHTIFSGANFGVTAPSGAPFDSFVIEIVMTAALLFVVLGSAIDSRATPNVAAIAIGFVIAVDVFIAGPISGASMNPARSFGPALLSGQLEHLWVYIAGPIVGGIVGALLYQPFFCDRPCAK